MWVSILYNETSHPVWVRGLKPILSELTQYHSSSHPVWVRGLKRFYLCVDMALFQRRTPCGCVD
nr:MAG TPA: hypothetical protein [Caudoviricetes sp.]